MTTFTVIALVLLVAALAVRRGIRERPRPRRIAGENPAEFRVMVLGGYRLYSWLVWLAVVLNVLGVGLRQSYITPAPWYSWLALLSFGIVLILAARVYWRLGYDSRRWWLVLGHVSLFFGLLELYGPLKSDIESYLDKVRGER